MAQLSDPLREILLPKLDRVMMSGGSWMAQCPKHDDSTASLHISRGDTQDVVLNCHAGCDPDDIIAAIKVTWDMLRSAQPDRSIRGEWTPFGTAEAIYDYTDEAGHLLFQVVRCPGKKFMQRRPDSSAKSGWAWKLGTTRRVLYRLPRLLKAVGEGNPIFVCEGEKDVQSLERAGVTATCNPMGAGPGKWLPEFCEPLREAIVFIIADRDEPGRLHARRVAEMLRPVAATVEIWEAASGKDATDHLNAGLSIREFNRPHGDSEPPVNLDPDIHEFLATQFPPEDWVIQNLLERGERLVVTGIEGYGKSTWLRQASFTTAAGAHMFRGGAAQPERVVHVDCENTERQSWHRFRELATIGERLGYNPPSGYLRILHRPEGIDLTRDDDAAWLMERIALYRPALLTIGPLYRLHVADVNDELPARRVAAVLDAARVSVNCALIMEAHSGHGQEGRRRSLRPIGSSLFLRWPEFGFGMDPVSGNVKNLFNFLPWRGGRDSTRAWPRQLIWCQGLPGEVGWPWQVYATPNGEWSPSAHAVD